MTTKRKLPLWATIFISFIAFSGAALSIMGVAWLFNIEITDETLFIICVSVGITVIFHAAQDIFTN